VRSAQIKVAGFGGQGVILAGIILGKAASIFDKYHATLIQSFGPEARGSACAAQVMIDADPIAYPYIKHPSILIAFNQDAYQLFGRQLQPDGLLIYEQDIVVLDDSHPATVRTVAVPATRIAEELGRRLVQNIVMVGAFAGIVDLISYEAVEKAVLDSIPRGTEELNSKALARGYEFSKSLSAVTA
jgi:2-oxoglutarate ferredoxin oxidoreductase subunit gamma